MFQHGRRWEICDVNPIDLVRQRGGRRSIPRVLSVHDMRLVLGELTEPYHTMVLIAACLGLRASESSACNGAILIGRTSRCWLGEVLSRAESAIRRQKPRGFLFRLIRVWPMPSGHTGSGVCTENPVTGYLRTARGSHDGRRAFCGGTSNPPPCVLASAKLAGTRFAIPTRACCVEWGPTSKSNKNCCGTPPSKAR